MKIMNLKNMTLLAVFAGSYYFLQSLATTQNIKNPTQEITTEAIQPNLIAQLSIDSIQESVSKETYQALLKNEEALIWTLVEKVTELSENACNDKKVKWESYYKESVETFREPFKHLPAVSEKTASLIKTVLNDFNINENDIVIQPFDCNGPAATDDLTCYINESILEQFSEKAQKFCLAHELQHFLNKDDSTNYVLLQHCPQDKEELSADHAIQQMSRLQELRADLGAATKSEEYAQGFKEFIMKVAEIAGDGPGTSHPKTSLRISYADLLLSKKTA